MKLKNSVKRLAAALLAACLLMLCACGATAESGLLGGLLGLFGGEESPAEDSGGSAGQGLAVNASLPADGTNILLLGTDSRTSEMDSRTDTMIVLSVNAVTGQAKLTSIMRDTWVDIPGHGGGKLNAACVYGGPALTVRCVNENFGLNIERYALVNMQCLVDIVDALGGIRLDVTSEESSAINALIASDANAHDENSEFATDPVPAGTQVLLNGRQALAYVRIRKSDSDYARTSRQRVVLETIARRLQQESMMNLMGMAMSLLNNVETNLSLDEIMAIATVGVSADMGSVEEMRVPVDGTFESGMFGDTWCIKPNFAQNAALLHSFIYGD